MRNHAANFVDATAIQGTAYLRYTNILSLYEIGRRINLGRAAVPDWAAWSKYPLTATWCEVDELIGAERVYCHLFFGLGDGRLQRAADFRARAYVSLT
ncbi:MAG: hypothetical protein QOF42_399 [Gammaproteobacteria bacterium]|jgi:hypothetical protein|nr:hypothetical protein [Gammaproteobacteria bacterium]